MLEVVWEFRVRPGREAEFEERYGVAGEWVTLFRQAEGYLGTTLEPDPAVRGRYVVVDTWRDAEAYRSFLARFGGAYAALDRECAALTEEERKVAEREVSLPEGS